MRGARARQLGVTSLKQADQHTLALSSHPSNTGMAIERALFVRERNDGLYRPLVYLLFKLLDEFVLMVPITAATSAAVFLACKCVECVLECWG